MTATLDALELNPAERLAAEEQIRRAAYLKWLAAGSPENQSEQHWREAELEWIEYQYVPHRAPECAEDEACAAEACASAGCACSAASHA